MAPPLQASRLVTLRPQRGVELQAVGITYTVKDHKSGQQLDLLKGVSATVRGCRGGLQRACPSRRK